MPSVSPALEDFISTITLGRPEIPNFRNFPPDAPTAGEGGPSGASRRGGGPPGVGDWVEKIAAGGLVCLEGRDGRCRLGGENTPDRPRPSEAATAP